MARMGIYNNREERQPFVEWRNVVIAPIIMDKLLKGETIELL